MNHKNILKIIGIILCLIILSVMCHFIVKMNRATIDEQNTPVTITPAKEKVVPQMPEPAKKPVYTKPIMRDENDIPKSDYKVPEIG